MPSLCIIDTEKLWVNTSSCLGIILAVSKRRPSITDSAFLEAL